MHTVKGFVLPAAPAAARWFMSEIQLRLREADGAWMVPCCALHASDVTEAVRMLALAQAWDSPCSGGVLVEGVHFVLTAGGFSFASKRCLDLARRALALPPQACMFKVSVRERSKVLAALRTGSA